MKGPTALLIFVLAGLFTCMSTGSAYSQPVVSITNSIINCGNSPSGSLTASSTGGTSPHTYYWYSSSWGLLATGAMYMPKNYATYYVIVKDSADLKDTASVTLSQLTWSISATPVLQAYGAHTNCNGNEGEVTISITGGTGPYRVVVTDPGVRPPPTGYAYHDTIISSTSITLGELMAQSYDVHVITNSGTGCTLIQGVTLESIAVPPLLRVSGELYPNGHYVSCDTCADGRFTFSAEGTFGDVNYGWLRTSPQFEPDILAGRATLSIPWDWQDGFSPSSFDDFDILVMDTTEIQMDTLSPETWYFALAMDEIGCMSVKTLWIERPRQGNGTWLATGITADSTTVLGTVNNEPLRMSTNDTVRMTVTPTGQVAIGTADAPDDYMLAVNGRVIAEEVEVKLQSDWPDFVFEEAYRLIPLDSLEAFIQRNGHLPGFPSAKSQHERGSVASGQMITSLVQKVEELTLYVIQLQKQVDALQSQGAVMDVKVRGLDRTVGNGNPDQGNGRPGNLGGQH